MEHRLRIPDRDVDPWVGIAWSRFEQQHAVAAVGGETVREDATGGSGADDVQPSQVHTSTVWITGLASRSTAIRRAAASLTPSSR